MKTDLITAAQARANQAQQELDSALEAGADTTQAREFLQAAEAELARLIEARDAELNQEKSAADEKLWSRVIDFVAGVESDLMGELQSLGFAKIPAFSIPTGPAMDYLRTLKMVEEDASAMAAHEENCKRISDRINHVQVRIDALIARRQAGDEKVADAAQHMLLVADRDGLRDLLARQVLPEQTRAGEWVSDAVNNWLAAVGETRAKVLWEMALEAEGCLCNVAKALADPGVNRAYTARRWCPSVRLQGAISGIYR